MGQVTVRIADEDKKEATRIVKELGLDMTTVTKAFYKQIIRERRVPLDFSLTALPADTRRALDESKLMEKDDTVKGYGSGASLIDAMNRESEL